MADDKKKLDDSADDGSDIEFIGTPEDAPKQADAGVTSDTSASASAETLSAELKKAKNDYLYLMAEFENYKRNAIRERSDLAKYGSERIVRELLDLMDTFDRAFEMEVTAENVASFREGMLMIAREMKNLLDRFGVKEIDSLGKPFDPAVHEALSSEESDSVTPGHISQVFKKAYKLHDRLIRPAQVVVAKEPKKDSSGD